MLHLYFLSSGQVTRPTVFFLYEVSCGLADVALVFPELGAGHQTNSVLPGQRLMVVFHGEVSCGLADVAHVFPELGPVHQTDGVLPGRSV